MKPHQLQDIFLYDTFCFGVVVVPNLGVNNSQVLKDSPFASSCIHAIVHANQYVQYAADTYHCCQTIYICNANKTVVQSTLETSDMLNSSVRSQSVIHSQLT